MLIEKIEHYDYDVTLLDNTKQSNHPKLFFQRVVQNLNNPNDAKMVTALYTLPEDTTEGEVTPAGTVRFKRTPK